MGIKESALAYLGQLKTVQVTNGDGNTVALYTAMWNDQIERKRKGDGYSYPTPAGFLELQFSEAMTMGMGATSYELTVRIMLEHEHYNTEGDFDQDLVIFDLKDKVHRAMNMFKAPNCSPLCTGNPTMDYNHDNTYLCVMEYRTHFIDYTGSMFDQDGGIYIEATLTNPELETVIIIDDNTIPTEPCVPAHAIALFDCIENIRCSIDGNGDLLVNLISASSINDNSHGPVAYFIDWGDSSPDETILVGTPISHNYDPWQILILEISSSYGAAVQLEIVTDGTGTPISYIPSFTQKFAYDLWCGYNPNYPITITSDMSIVDGFTDYTIMEYSGNVIAADPFPTFPQTHTFKLDIPINHYTVYYHTQGNDQQLQAVTIVNISPI
jgi:hypothetical protein